MIFAFAHHCSPADNSQHSIVKTTQILKLTVMCFKPFNLIHFERNIIVILPYKDIQMQNYIDEIGNFNITALSIVAKNI